MSEGRVTETIWPYISGECRRCTGRGLEGLFGMPVTCPRCDGSGRDPEPDKPYTRVVAWIGGHQ